MAFWNLLGALGCGTGMQGVRWDGRASYLWRAHSTIAFTCVANSEKERLIISSTDKSSVRSRLRIMLYVRRNWLASLQWHRHKGGERGREGL